MVAVTRIACYPEVAKALGEVQAKVELQKVWDAGNKSLWHNLYPNLPDMAVHDFCNRTLGYAFDWANTPQGFEFWWEVSRANS